MKSIIEDLEQQVEHWRQRAEAAEAALRGPGEDWSVAVRPLYLSETRIMRLLVRRDMSTDAIIQALQEDHPCIDRNGVKVRMSRIRKILPASIVPPRAYRTGGIYTIPDRPALKAFLETGEIARPEQRRAA